MHMWALYRVVPIPKRYRQHATLSARPSPRLGLNSPMPYTTSEQPGNYTLGIFSRGPILLATVQLAYAHASPALTRRR